jgi:hypothetical protein
MRRGISFALIALSLAPAAAGAAERKTPAKEPVVPQLMQSCDAHKFETVVHAKVDGQIQDKKVKLCGVEGQSDADWIKTLKDAIQKLQANKEMDSAVRDQIVGAINREIARLSIEGSAPVPLRRRNVGSGAGTSVSRDYSTLPPIPPPRETAETPVAPPVDNPLPPSASAAAPVRQESAQLPPLPTAPVSAPAPVARPIAIPVVAPRLTFGCDAPGELTSDAPCADFARETMLTVHARDDVPAGTLLQFVRNDRSLAELSLDGLRRGKALRTALPAEVCRGFTSGKLELRIVRGEAGSEVLSTDGPYSLRC